ncbi:MAG: hypothetical protein ACRDMZ_23950 [Solirubrobacteraceae bacterium]
MARALVRRSRTQLSKSHLDSKALTNRDGNVLRDSLLELEQTGARPLEMRAPRHGSGAGVDQPNQYEQPLARTLDRPIDDTSHIQCTRHAIDVGGRRSKAPDACGLHDLESIHPGELLNERFRNDVRGGTKILLDTGVAEIENREAVEVCGRRREARPGTREGDRHDREHQRARERPHHSTTGLPLRGM